MRRDRYHLCPGDVVTPARGHRMGISLIRSDREDEFDAPLVGTLEQGQVALVVHVGSPNAGTVTVMAGETVGSCASYHVERVSP